MNPIEKIRQEQERVKRIGTAHARIQRKKELKRKVNNFLAKSRRTFTYTFWFFWVLAMTITPFLVVAALWKYLGE